MRTLRLVRERRLADLIPRPSQRGVLEASGVFAKGRDCFVVFDNVRRVARIDRDLAPGSSGHSWLGRARYGEGYEDIAYSPHTKRFYLLIEAEKHPDGTFKAVIEECDEAFKYKGRRWADVAFDKQNTGFEGLSACAGAGPTTCWRCAKAIDARRGAKAARPAAGAFMFFRNWAGSGNPSPASSCRGA